MPTPLHPWRATDPREHYNKRGNIVICTHDGALRGYVETKYGWDIDTTHRFDRYSSISADDPWPEGWLWTPAPTP